MRWPELSGKWWRRYRAPTKEATERKIADLYRDSPTETPFLNMIDPMRADPYGEQRAGFLKQRNEGRITMGQYHSAMDISRLAEAQMITQQQAVVRFQRLFPLKELP